MSLPSRCRHVMLQSRTVFINLRVRDLRQSVAFFASLGFGFNTQFTDANAACLVLSDQVAIMLLTDATFREHTDREPCDTDRFAAGVFSLTCDSREAVDQLVELALEQGGSPAMPTQNLPSLYARSFRCPDGHHFEAVCMVPTRHRSAPQVWDRPGQYQLVAGY
jgi:uncharacterized protein